MMKKHLSQIDSLALSEDSKRKLSLVTPSVLFGIAILLNIIPLLGEIDDITFLPVTFIYLLKNIVGRLGAINKTMMMIYNALRVFIALYILLILFGIVYFIFLKK